MYQPKTGAKCYCKKGVMRDNCSNCEGTGMVVDFKAIRKAKPHHTPTIDADALMTCLLGIGYLPERAAFIVRAVNSHEELLNIARRVVAHGHTRPGDCYGDEYMGLCVCGHDKAKEAIAKAEGK